MFEGTCYHLEVPPENAIPLANWVLTRQTPAYSAWNPYEKGISVSEANITSVIIDDINGSPQEGFVPIELAQQSIAEILHFLDFELVLNTIDDTQTKERYNSRLLKSTPDFNTEAYARVNPYNEYDSYINTDTDTDLRAQLVNGIMQLEGSVSRFYWVEYEGTEYPYITQVKQACDPESIRTYDVQNCSELQNFGYVFEPGIDDRFEPGDYVAFYLVVGTTADSILANQAEVQKSSSENVFLSLPNTNAERFKHFSWNIEDESFTHVHWKTEEDESLLLEWEDTIGGGDGDFNDLKIGVSNVSESGVQGVFKIEDLGDWSTLDFQIMGKDAAYISEFGFFKVDDSDGSIDELMPNHPDYMNAALNRSRRSIVVSYDVMSEIHEEINTYYQYQKEATLLVQTAAVFRRFANDNPQELEDFLEESK
jgi:Domain of unknown function (DUF4114)